MTHKLVGCKAQQPQQCLSWEFQNTLLQFYPLQTEFPWKGWLLPDNKDSKSADSEVTDFWSLLYGQVCWSSASPAARSVNRWFPRFGFNLELASSPVLCGLSRGSSAPNKLLKLTLPELPPMGNEHDVSRSMSSSVCIPIVSQEARCWSSASPGIKSERRWSPRFEFKLELASSPVLCEFSRSSCAPISFLNVMMCCLNLDSSLLDLTLIGGDNFDSRSSLSSE